MGRCSHAASSTRYASTFGGSVQDLTSKLTWMREAAMAIDPTDELFAPHMRPILQQLVEKLKALGPMLYGPDASQCRMVLHLMNALLHQLKD